MQRMCQFFAPSVLGAGPFWGLVLLLGLPLPFTHGVPRVPHIYVCLIFSIYPVSFGICPGCLLRRRFLRLYVDCGALGMGGWWFIDDSTLRAWSLLRPLILCGEFLWTSVSPLVSDCGREGPLCALLEVYWLPFVGSLQASLCCLRPLCRFAAWALGCVCSADATAVACFGCRGFFLGILAGSMCGALSWVLRVRILLVRCSCCGTELLGAVRLFGTKLWPGGFFLQVILVQLCLAFGSA